YDGETLSALRMIPGIGGQTFANAINELGQVVGSSVAAGGAFEHATLWNGYQVFDLNNFLDENSKSAGWVLTEALDINDHGWVVGEAENSITGEKHAFLFSSGNPIPPVPEPQLYFMWLAGLVLVGLMLRNKV
ncbi:MAG: PEP-CTERM sorting domain-containing protein, partial [Nitrosomonas sp.]